MHMPLASSAQSTVRSLLPWVGLYALAAVAAYGLQLAATPRPADAAAQSPVALTNAVPPPYLDDPRLMYVTIVVRDRATGFETSSRCLARKDEVASDVVLVFAEDASAVTSSLCQPSAFPSDPSLQPG
jgi:hypothetical protein